MKQISNYGPYFFSASVAQENTKRTGINTDAFMEHRICSFDPKWCHCDVMSLKLH